MRSIAFAFVVSALAPAWPASAELRIPLTVTEPSGMGNSHAHVSTGVPLLPGQARGVKALRLLDAAGREVPAQFRELSRWWQKDNSLRWVLVDFKTKIGGFERKRLTLTDGRSAGLTTGGRGQYDSPLKVRTTDDAIVVTTGPAQFTISRKRFNLFDRVRIDRNGDGQFSDDEEAVRPRADNGSVVEDTFGQKYLSSAGTERVVVEEAGPIRVCVLAKGVHRAAAGKGYSKGMYGYDIRLHFLAGTGLVRVDTVLHNGSREPLGSPVFEDYSLRLKLNLTPEPLPFDPGHPKVCWTRMYGQAPIDRALQPGESMRIYQDSNGSETWRVNPGFRGKGLDKLSSFRGYRITLAKGGHRETLAAGDHARGLVGIGGRNFGVVVVPRYFWQQFPKAIEVGSDGALRIGILPAEYKSVHWLADAAGCGYDVTLHFYGRKLSGGARGQYPRDNRTKSDKHRGLMRDRPKPHCIADVTIPRLVALCEPAHYAACGALADMGPYLPIRGAKPFALPVTERRYFMTDYLKGNAYGWQVFGARWEEHAGHTPYNYEPIQSSDFLFRYITSGHPTWLEFGLRRNVHFRSVRAFRIERPNVFAAKSWKEFSTNSVWEDAWGRRPQPTGAEIAKYSKGRYPRTEWQLPDPAHICLDELYDLYCLFGDTRARESTKHIAAAGGAYVSFRRGGIDRLNGWSLRALIRYYDLTADKQCLPVIRRAFDNFWQLARRHRSDPIIPPDRKGSPYEGWFVNICGRAFIIAYNVTGDERMRDLALGLAQGRAAQKLRYPSVCAFTYDQTGDRRYRYAQPERFATHYCHAVKQVYSQNYFPACDGWLWARPRPDKVAPAAVKDLAATALGGGKVKLTWTAPGDDGEKGAAAVYQAKWCDVPIVEAARGRGQASFWAAENVTGEPGPAKAGTKQQMVLTRPRPGGLHFALKARDELNNESPISNVAAVSAVTPSRQSP